MTPIRRARLAFVLVVLGAAACATTSRDAVLARTLAGLNAARDAFTTWDAQHQLALVEAAPSRAEGEASLAAYRAQRAKVTTALVGAYGAVAAASLSATASSLIEVTHAAESVLAALRELGVVK